MSARGVSELDIAGRKIGPGHGAYIIAEAGSNHDGRLEQALRLIDVAAEAGADAVKFQAFRAEGLYPPGAGKSAYLGDERDIYDIIKAMVMPPEWLPRLAEYAQRRSIAFLCSTFDEASVDLVAPHVAAFKCASYEMTHAPLLHDMARRGKPVLLSTGTASLHEVESALYAARATGNDRFVLLQCTASYPAPLESLDLRSMVTMREAFGVLTGFSDHSRDPIAGPMAAAALGAAVIEKHFTLSNRLPGPDHAYAVEPHELAEMVRRVREVECALGNGRKEVHAVEGELRAFARRTIFTARAIAPGEILTLADLSVLRCGTRQPGLDPLHLPALVGRKVQRALEPFATVCWDDLDRPAPVLRPAAAADSETVWRWNNEPSVRRISFRGDPIAWDTHRVWFTERLADRSTWMVVVEMLGRGAGVVRFQREGDLDVVSITVAPEYRGSGLGSAALRLACDRFAVESGRRRIVARIKPDNQASVRAFERAGFRRIGEDGAALVYERTAQA